MKQYIALLALIASTCLSQAGDAKSTAKFIDSITVAPFAALQTDGLNGKSTLGSGLDLGVGINKFVSIHVTGLAYETDSWRGSTIDESEAYVSADLTKFANDTFLVSLKGGAVTDWTEGDYGLAVGLGARIQLSKVLSIGSDYSVRAWFAEREKDSLARLFVSYKF